MGLRLRSRHMNDCEITRVEAKINIFVWMEHMCVRRRGKVVHHSRFLNQMISANQQSNKTMKVIKNQNKCKLTAKELLTFSI